MKERDELTEVVFQDGNFSQLLRFILMLLGGVIVFASLR